MNLKDAMNIRLQRNTLIKALSQYGEAYNYAKLTEEQKIELDEYMQELRDIPQNQFPLEECQHPDDIVWPEKPEWVK